MISKQTIGFSNTLKLSLLLSIFVLSQNSCKSPEELFEKAICIENISTIDPEDGLKENQTIIIQSGKILKVSPTKDLLLSKENTIIDGTGKFIIPGLWDAHIHFAFLTELAPSMFDLFLVNGVTSVRDTGGEIGFVKKWKDKSLADPLNTPRVMIAGPLLDGMPNVYDGSGPAVPPLSVGLASVEDVINKINELESLDVDFLKSYEMLSPDQFKKLNQLAKEKGFKVTGHVTLSMDVISASNAGLNSMEHMRNLELSCASNSDELLQQRKTLLEAGKKDKGSALRSRIHQMQRKTAVENYDETQAQKVLAVLAKNQTWQIPTLTLNTSSATRYYTTPEWQESFSLLPDSTEQKWKKYIDEIALTEIDPFRKEYSKWMFEMTGKVHAAGIDIMAGTDCPISFLTPGRSLHQELLVLVDAGLTPLEAIKTATINPAKYFNMEDELGRIKSGMWADLLILNSNPLDDINNTRKIHGVIKQGNYMDRSKLDEMMTKLSAN